MFPPPPKFNISPATPTTNPLRVIIVGGGVAGLTLANCLQHHGIDFILLEKRAEIAPDVGASIVILPNGARILDQLGIFDRVPDLTFPLSYGSTYAADGKLLGSWDAPLLIQKRTGYPISYLLRKNLLEVLLECLEDKGKVSTSKCVDSIVQDGDKPGVTVRCEDGSSYSGDIVVGADGIRSNVVKLMREKIENVYPGATKKDQISVTADYNCIFGISDPLEKGILKAGWSHRTYSKDRSTMVFIGERGKLFWFLFGKLDRTYGGADAPRYTKDDTDEAAKEFLNLPVTDSITWKEVWDNRKSCTLTCIEEAENEYWNFGRIVCIGDSVHKSTANLGTGGNAAIESAASLVNTLTKLPPNPTSSQISAALQSFYEKRHERANAVSAASNDLTRIEAFRTPFHKFMGMYVTPSLGDYLADVTCDAMCGSEKLDNLSTPVKSLQATMPWDTDTGICRKERKWVRALWALPLLLVFVVAQRARASLFQQISLLVQASITSGELDLGNGRVVEFQGSFSGIKSVDEILAPLVALYTPILQPVDQEATMQAITFGAGILAFQTVVLLEGLRRGNFMTIVYFIPTIISFAYQLKGLALAAPIYFFIHYVQSPLENYHAADNRLVQIGPTKTIIPTLVLSYIIPSIAMFIATPLATRQWITGVVWIPFPIYTSFIQRILNLFVKDTTDKNRIANPSADLPYLQYTYIFAFAIAAVSSTLAGFSSPRKLPPISSFLQTVQELQSPTAATTIAEGTMRYLAYNKFLTSVASTIWILLSFSDLVKAKKLDMGFLKIVGIYIVGLVVFGPGAAMIGMWAWRESILAKGR